jgi:hypothetical protein
MKVKGNALVRRRASRWRLRERSQSPLQRPKPRSPDCIQCHCPSAGCDPRSRMFQRRARRGKPIRGTTRRIEEVVTALYPLMPFPRSACEKIHVADPPYCHLVPEDTLIDYRTVENRKLLKEEWRYRSGCFRENQFSELSSSQATNRPQLDVSGQGRPIVGPRFRARDRSTASS